MLTPAWPEKVFGFAVVRSPIGAGVHIGAFTNIVLHTTEGPPDGDPRPTFSARGDAPHFAISAKAGGTIWQLRSLDQTAAALRHGTLPPGADSPNAHALQIEICGFTGDSTKTPTKPWQPAPVIAERLAAVVAYMSEYHHVPLVVPNPAWRDDCSDMPLPWAENNTRRRWAGQADRWPTTRGVWGHVEVPWQDPTWHYDPGALGRQAVLAAARKLLEPPPPPGGDEMNEAEVTALLNKTLTTQTLGDAEVQALRAKAVDDYWLGNKRRTGQAAAYGEAFDKMVARHGAQSPPP